MFCRRTIGADLPNTTESERDDMREDDGEDVGEDGEGQARRGALRRGKCGQGCQAAGGFDTEEGRRIHSLLRR